LDTKFERKRLSLLQSLNPNIDIVFLLFVLQYILIIGNVEVNPGPELINHSSVSDNSISVCSINICSARNKLDFLNNFTDEFDIIAVTETHLHPNISNNDIEIDSFSKHIIRKDRNNAGGGLLIYFKDYISVIRKNELENHIDESICVGCTCVSVTAMISNSSVKLLRKSNLFRALRIFMLHIEMELSLTFE
jgi:hypothetical protein